MIPRPFPSKIDLLDRLKRLQVPMAAVLDVGVRESTSELMTAFPDLKHHLFEPVSLFYPAIAANYSHIDHTLHAMALSSVDETKFLLVTSLLKNGVVTHSFIRDEPMPIDGREVISCGELAVRRFDSLSLDVPENALLKVDVDGGDLSVLKGFGDKLSTCSVVIVELTYRTFGELTDFLTNRNFELFDLVDLVYYGDGLYQFDGAFIRRDLIDTKVRPPIGDFEREKWYPLFQPKPVVDLDR